MIPGARGVTTDACVPVSKLPEMLIKTREDIDAAGLTGTYYVDLLCSGTNPRKRLQVSEVLSNGMFLW